MKQTKQQKQTNNSELDTYMNFTLFIVIPHESFILVKLSKEISIPNEHKAYLA
jgi:hypothetical protein